MSPRKVRGCAISALPSTILDALGPVNNHLYKAGKDLKKKKRKRKAILLNKKSHSVRVGCDKDGGRVRKLGLKSSFQRRDCSDCKKMD